MTMTLVLMHPSSNAEREPEVKRRMKRRFSIEADNGAMRIFELAGREAWGMQQLVAAGEAGCTPIANPGPRWSHYIWKLRGRGFDIRTQTERHGGEFPGNHARYVLRSKVQPVLSHSGSRNVA